MKTSLENNSLKSNKEVIVVSGSSGLIGKAVINRLSEKYRMIGLDNAGYPYPPITAECVCMDMTDEKSIQEGFERIRYGYGDRIATVIHLAAYYSFSGKASPLYEKLTVHGTESLMKVLQSFSVGQFIFSSSLLVYKPTAPGIKITEESPLDPKWDYPKSKVKTEKILHNKRGKIPVVNLRIAGIYDEKGDSIPLTNHIQRIYESQLTSHFFPGDVTHGNPYLHLDDLVDAIVDAVERRDELPPEITINLGEDETLSFMELQQTFAKLIHKRAWNTYKIPKSLAKVGSWIQNIFMDPFIKPWMIDMSDDHMELDISKAKNVLGWEPKHTLRETIPRMIDALKTDPKKWYHENKLK